MQITGGRSSGKDLVGIAKKTQIFRQNMTVFGTKKPVFVTYIIRAFDIDIDIQRK